MDIKDVQKLITEKKDNVLLPMVQSMSENFAKAFETGVEVGIEIGKTISPDYSKVWHKPTEEPLELYEILFKWDSPVEEFHEVGYYHKDTKLFGDTPIDKVIKWAYVEDIVSLLNPN